MPFATSKRIDDGHSTIITLTSPSTVKLYEKEVTPPGVDGGGANPTTTMRNVVWRTNAPKKLKTLDEITLTASFATDVYSDLVAAVNVNQLITITFPDGSTLAVYAWLNMFKPNRFVEAEQPTAAVTFICSNQDTTGAEVGPVYTAPAA